MFKEKYNLNDLLEIMKKLRSEDGCPWDREQTHDSLKPYLIEEAYEVLDAVEAVSNDKLTEELGDVLLQVVFHSQIASEAGEFCFDDVADRICKKLIYRHPHVFSDVIAKTSSQVLTNWEKLKKDEKGLNTQTGVMMDVPHNMPALMRSSKVQQKAAQVGFDWENSDGAMGKVIEEIEELKEVYLKKDKNLIEDELGDAIFSLVNLARFFEIQPELAVHRTIKKFITRFEYIEIESTKAGKKLQDMTLEEMDRYWEEAKEQ